MGDDFSDANLMGQRWEGRAFERCDFTDADLRRLVTAGCAFTQCTFERTDPGASEHSASAFRSCTFRGATLASATFTGARTWLGSVFVDCVLRPVELVESDLTLAGLSRARLRKVVARAEVARGQPGGG